MIVAHSVPPVFDTSVLAFESIIHKMGSVGALGVEYTTYSTNFGNGWPFVTLPNFKERAWIARHMSGALLVGNSPVVTREHFDAWDDYTMGTSNKWMYVLLWEWAFLVQGAPY
jgi:hypothetical protein